MTGHAYNVRPIASYGRMQYQAECDCGAFFVMHDDRQDAGLDGLDHVREVEGRRLRRLEIVDELAAKETTRQKLDIERR